MISLTWLFLAVVASLSSLVAVIVLVVAAAADGGLPLSRLVVVVVRRQLNLVTGAGFDGSSIVVGSFWCSSVSVGVSIFHIKVSGVSSNLYGSLRWLI